MIMHGHVFRAAVANLCNNYETQYFALWETFWDKGDNECSCCAQSNTVFSSQSLTSTVDEATFTIPTIPFTSEQTVIDRASGQSFTSATCVNRLKNG